MQDPERRQQAKLLAAFLVVVIASMLQRLVMAPLKPTYPFAEIAIQTAIFVAAYIMSRTTWYYPAAGLTVANFSVVPLEIVLLRGAPPTESLIWMVLAVILSAVLLPKPVTIVTSLGLIVETIAVIVVRPSIDFFSISNVMSLVAVVSILTVVFSYHRDGLERMRQTELRQAKERLEVILGNSPVGISFCCPGGMIEQANPSFQSLLGYTADELRATQIADLGDGLHRDALAEALALVIVKQQDTQLEIRVCRKNNSVFDASLSLAPIVAQEQVAGIVCTLQDITPFQEAQRAKDAILSTAAHELRTPLTSIKGFSEILLTRNLTPERQKRFLSHIHRQATYLAEIVDDLLDVSRINSQYGLEVRPQPVDLARIISDTIQTFRDIGTGHTYVLKGNRGSLPVCADPFRLAQVLRHLVSNAVKYSPGGGTITVSSCIVPGFVEVSVQDEGIGIAPDQQVRIFEPFYRVDTSHSAVGGVGLGLTITKDIVELHGGRIWCKSESGAGSTFTFTIPLAEDCAAHPTS